MDAMVHDVVAAFVRAYAAPAGGETSPRQTTLAA
jgi:hypothetical protein